MFKKILIAEDFDCINLGVKTMLEEFVSNDAIHHAKYCDDALIKVKGALHNQEPFDLLISDLSFTDNYREVKLKSGEELIDAIKKVQPNIKIVVFSVETKPLLIKTLLEKLDCNGYVGKGRDGIKELKEAIQLVYNTDKKYLSPQLDYTQTTRRLNEIDDLDKQIIQLLATGLDQNEIGEELGYSRSSIEKRLNKLKIYFKAKNNPHLVSLSKDLGLI